MKEAEINIITTGISRDSTPQEIVNYAAAEKKKYYIENNLTPDDLWILLPLDVHKAILKNCEREQEGPDRITQRSILGMHAIHDYTKRVYIIPKQRLPKEQT